MEVILLDDIDTLGLRGEVVNVARGYARNFLLPRRLAEPATPAKVAELRKRDEQRARHEAHNADQAQQIAEVLSKTVLRFEVKAGPTGSLFGSVTPTNIADELWRTKKIRVDRRKIGIDTIKRIGRFEVPIELFQDVRATVNTQVVPEGGELPSEEELAAMEAQERGEPEAPAAEAPAAQQAGEPTLDEALAAEAPAVDAPAVEAPALEEVMVEAPEPTGEQAEQPETAAEGEAEIEHAEPPAPETTEETA
jgi:large subunit ribosomal protein L9